MILRIDLTQDIFREFDIDKEVSLDEFIYIFSDLTSIKSTKNSYIIDSPGLRIYLINGTNYLKIMHFSKDAFNVALFINGENFSYTSNYYRKDIPEIVSAFSENRLQDLKIFLKSKNKDNKWSPKDFERTDYTFPSKHFFRPSMILDLVVFFIINSILFLSFIPFSVFEFIFINILSLSFLSYPALFYINHYKCSRNITISISRKEIKIQIDGTEKIFKYSEIENVNYYSNRGVFSYSNIKLKNSSTLQFSEEYFHLNKIIENMPNVEVIWWSGRFPYLKRPKFSN